MPSNIHAFVADMLAAAAAVDEFTVYELRIANPDSWVAMPDHIRTCPTCSRALAAVSEDGLAVLEEALQGATPHYY